MTCTSRPCGSSCGCTQPRVVKDTLKSHEQGAILCEFNTHAFSGQHGARVTVTIDRPQYAEVELQVRGYVRTDVVLDPGQVNLGSVAQGKTADKKINIQYAGRGDWRITGVTGQFALPDGHGKGNLRGHQATRHTSSTCS